jgi:hypothetical protein
MHRYIHRLLLGGLLLAGSVSSFAQDKDTVKGNLEEVVIKKHKAATQIGLMDPIKTELISERELLKAACCNLSESFETTPSVDVAFTDLFPAISRYRCWALPGHIR